MRSSAAAGTAALRYFLQCYNGRRAGGLPVVQITEEGGCSSLVLGERAAALSQEKSQLADSEKRQGAFCELTHSCGL